MQIFLLAFISSLLVTLAVIHFSHIHEKITADHDLKGVQKFHARPVPRIGGVGVFIALLLVSAFLYFIRRDPTLNYFLLLLCVLPAFAGGLIEDLTKNVGAKWRLLISMVGALLAYFLLGAVLTRLDFSLIDPLLLITPIAVVFTLIAVAGITNAINIIDGFNGLASAVSLMFIGGLCYVCIQVQDQFLMNICFAMMGGILGFFLFNWPRGLIFLGDGGAYLIGFMIAEVAVLLVARHPQVSPWFPFLLVIYPIIETLFSMYRRKFVRRRAATLPDGVHLHTLIFRRIVRWAAGEEEAKNITRRNSLTAPYLWLLSALSSIPAVLFWQHTAILMAFSALFILTYIWLYWRIVRFRTPKVLRGK